MREEPKKNNQSVHEKQRNGVGKLYTFLVDPEKGAV